MSERMAKKCRSKRSSNTDKLKSPVNAGLFVCFCLKQRALNSTCYNDSARAGSCDPSACFGVLSEGGSRNGDNPGSCFEEPGSLVIAIVCALV